jgi:tetratricopeptide (TPR) repeat protein
MQLKKLNIFIAMALSVFMAPSLFGQDKVSESEVKIQQAFIEANKQKLLGNLDKALEAYEGIWRDHNDISVLAFEMARVYIEKEEMSKGLEYIQKAVDLEPTNLWYLKFLANIFEQMGQNADGAEVYGRIVSLTPDDEEAYNKWAFLLTKGEQIAAAIEVFDKAEERFGINEEIIRQKYTLYLGSGKQKKAEKELVRLVETFPKETLYLEMLAGFYEQVNQPEDAKKVFQEILAIDPGNTKAQMALAGQTAAVSDEVRFLETLEDIYKNEEVELGLKIERIQPLIDKAIAETDLPIAEKILSLSTILEQAHSSKAAAFYLSARMLKTLGRTQEAEEKLKQTLDLDDTRFDYWEELMKLQWNNEQYKALSNTSMDAMDIFPNQPICYYYHGRSMSAVGNVDAAFSVLDQALLMSESNKPLLQKIHLALAEAWAVDKKQDRALAAYKEALKVDAENAEVLTEYAYYLAQEKKELEYAVQMAQKAVKMDTGDAFAQRSLAWTMYQSGDFKNAQKAMEKAMEKGFGQHPIALEQYGDILFQLGEQDRALEFWNKAKANGNESKVLDKKISEKRLY